MPVNMKSMVRHRENEILQEHRPGQHLTERGRQYCYAAFVWDDERSYADIAERLGVSESNVRKVVREIALAKALKRLRDLARSKRQPD